MRATIPFLLFAALAGTAAAQSAASKPAAAAAATATATDATVPAQAALASEPVAVPTERALRESCSWAASGMRVCIQKHLAQSESDLKAAEAAVQSAIAQWDAEPRNAKATRQRLSESAAAFIQYRTAQCSLYASLGGGAIGNALEAQREACAADLNWRRAESLTAIAQDMRAR